MIFGRTDIFKVSERGTERDLQRLLSRGVDVNQATGGRTPLHIAAARGEIELVRLLAHYGANKTARDNSGRTPLECAQAQFQKLRDGIEEAYANPDERASVRGLMRSLAHLLRIRNNHPVIQAEITDLAFEAFTDIDEERMRREFYHAEEFMAGIRMYGDTSKKLLLLMSSGGPRQVAYRLLLRDVTRLNTSLSEALK